MVLSTSEISIIASKERNFYNYLNRQVFQSIFCIAQTVTKPAIHLIVRPGYEQKSCARCGCYFILIPKLVLFSQKTITSLYSIFLYSQCLEKLSSPSANLSRTCVFPSGTSTNRPDDKSPRPGSHHNDARPL